METENVLPERVRVYFFHPPLSDADMTIEGSLLVDTPIDGATLIGLASRLTRITQPVLHINNTRISQYALYGAAALANATVYVLEPEA